MSDSIFPSFVNGVAQLVLVFHDDQNPTTLLSEPPDMPRLSSIMHLLSKRVAVSESRSFLTHGLTTSIAIHGFGIGLLLMMGFLDSGIFDPVVPYPPRREVAAIYVPPSASASNSPTSSSVKIPIDQEAPEQPTLEPATTAFTRPSPVGELPHSDAIEPALDAAEAPAQVMGEVTRPERPTEIQGESNYQVQASGAMSRASIGMDSLVTPRVLRNPPAQYPPDALRAGIEGTVVLWVGVAADGSVEFAEIKRTSGTRSLDQSALRTVRKWRFLPAINPQAGVRYVNIPFKFVIERR